MTKKLVLKSKRVSLILDSFQINIRIIAEKHIFPMKMPVESFM